MICMTRLQVPGKEIKEDLKRWNGFPCSWIDRINILKMAILQKATYGFGVIPIKIPNQFIRVKKSNVQIHLE